MVGHKIWASMLVVFVVDEVLPGMFVGSGACALVFVGVVFLEAEV